MRKEDVQKRVQADVGGREPQNKFMDYYNPHLITDVNVKCFVECVRNTHQVEGHKAHKKHQKDHEDSELGLRLSAAVVAPRVSEGLHDFQRDTDVAKPNHDADHPEQNLHG
ncbi:hypothetical protein EYF80_009341 [Liparis tanakae]|uniref:Uncharacterized protein n=1 Tax=Liparis tanakae TaxID=230148 RepID=A0A4Z2IRD4_9TELE|nr:hypothetical protein EYF80_009341 [Liparis tanakae]